MPAPFGFEIDGQGARVVVEHEPLCPDCTNDDEVDYQIGRLIASLQQAGRDMKAALQEPRDKPPGRDASPAT